MLIEESERIWKEPFVLQSKYYSEIYLQELRKTTKYLRRNDVSLKVIAEQFRNENLEHYICT
jgi:hypothetical protein